jgi:hypothetical protein
MWTRPSALRLRVILLSVLVLASAGFVIWAVASSGSGGGRTTTVRIGGGLPTPQSSPIAVRLANAVVRANLGPRFRTIDMTRVAALPWDRVYVFRDTTSGDISRRLGFDWSDAPDAVPRSGQQESLLVFKSGRRVAASAFFSDAIGHLDCLAAENGYPRGTRFVVRFTDHGHDPYLASSPPDAAEKACLNAVGAPAR